MADRRYSVEVRFNSRLKGSGQSHRCEVDADDPFEALEKASAEAVRLPDHGQSIYLVGCTIDEVKNHG